MGQCGVRWLSGWSAGLAIDGASVRILLAPCFRTLALPFTPLCQCLSEETLKAIGRFYLVSMAEEVKYPTQRGKCVTCRGLHNSEINHFCISLIMCCLEYTYLRQIT